MLVQRRGIAEVMIGGTETTAHTEVTGTLIGILRMSGNPILIEHADALVKSMGLIVFGVSDVRHGCEELGTPPCAKIGMDGPIEFLRGEVYARRYGVPVPYLNSIASFTANRNKLAGRVFAEQGGQR